MTMILIKNNISKVKKKVISNIRDVAMIVMEIRIMIQLLLQMIKNRDDYIIMTVVIIITKVTL